MKKVGAWFCYLAMFVSLAVGVAVFMAFGEVPDGEEDWQ